MSNSIRKMAARVSSFGDYNVKTNSIIGGGMSAPIIAQAGANGDIVVRHREYILDVDPTSAFTIAAELPINPGMRITFPWLATIAANFEEYDFKGLVFQFHSTSSDAVLSSSASSALGTISMATQYNVLSPPFRSKLEMLNYQFSNSSKPSLDLFHPVECQNHANVFGSQWVRTENTSLVGADRRLYDMGDFTLTTDGIQGTGGSIGELWAGYEIVLKKPKLDSVGTSDTFDLGTVTAAAPFLNPVAGDFNDLGGVINTAGTSYTFPPNLVGKFLVYWRVTGASTAITQTGFTISNRTLVQFFGENLASNEVPDSTETSISMMTCSAFETKPLDGQTVITMTGAVIPASITSGVLSITRISDSILPDPYA